VLSVSFSVLGDVRARRVREFVQRGPDSGHVRILARGCRPEHCSSLSSRALARDVAA
jgi:hypothetical protein